MVLAHKEKAPGHMTQRDLARARFSGSHPTPLPGPGVFALRNSAATPSILPDGGDAPGSVDPALEAEHVGDTGGSVHHR
jgi:NADH-quinone oxidoreductase subunit J